MDGNEPTSLESPTPSDAVALRALIRSFVAIRHGADFTAGTVTDIGSEGVFIASDRVFPRGSELDLKFALRSPKGPSLVELKGTVARLVEPDPAGGSPGGMGVQFLALDNETKRTIQGFVDRSELHTIYDRDAGVRSSVGFDDEKRFEVRSLLGEGGTCNVYLAFDRELDDVVALKILKQKWADEPIWRERFRKEIKLTRMINSPHVAKLYDIGRFGQRTFFTMEYIEGQTLQQQIAERGRLEVDPLLDVAEQALSGVAAAHALDIIHRDLKPSNVMIRENGSALVVDFGFARQPEDTALTAPNRWVGTVLYMSPEGLLGQTVDFRSDVYSFGCLLYAGLTGHPPFRGPPAEVARQHVDREPRPIAEVRPDIDPELERLVLRCLSKDPAERFTDAAELGAAIRGFRTDTVLDTRPTASRRQRVLVAVNDPRTVGRIQARLEILGYKVEGVADGFAAVETCMMGGVHALFIDTRAGVMDGLSVCQTLRSDPRTASLPVGLVTDGKEFEGSAGFLPGTHFLRKPLGDAALAESLEKLGLATG